MVKIQKNHKKLRYLLIIVALAILAAGVFFVLTIQRDGNVASTTPGSSVNYQPPTKEDKQAAQDAKERVVQRDETLKNQAGTTPSGKIATKPVITYAGQYGAAVEIGGYANVFESSGTCTAILAKATTKLTKTVNAVRNVNAMDCPVMSFNAGEFTEKGTYDVRIEYNSNTATGVSDRKTIEVK